MKNIIIASCFLLGLNLNLDVTKGNFSVTCLQMQAQGQSIPQYFQPAVWIVSSSGAGSGISTIGAIMMTSWQCSIAVEYAFPSATRPLRALLQVAKVR